MEWDLSVSASTSKTGITASGILNQGDSAELTFSGVDVLPNSAAPIIFAFDNALIPNALYSYDNTKRHKANDYYDDNSKAGHKEFVMNAYVKGADGVSKVTQILLPFDVTKR